MAQAQLLPDARKQGCRSRPGPGLKRGITAVAECRRRSAHRGGLRRCRRKSCRGSGRGGNAGSSSSTRIVRASTRRLSTTPTRKGGGRDRRHPPAAPPLRLPHPSGVPPIVGRRLGGRWASMATTSTMRGRGPLRSRSACPAWGRRDPGVVNFSTTTAQAFL